MANRNRKSLAGLTIHPVLDLFPAQVAGPEFEALCDDIQANGLKRQPARTTGAKPQLLDGRSRIAACERLGLPFEFEEIPPDQAEAFVISLNLRHRHLSTSQRALIAAQLAAMKPGQHVEGADDVTQDQAAERLNVSPRLVRAAKRVWESGDERLIQAVRTDAMAASAASTLLGRPERERERTLALVAEGSTFAKASRTARTAAPARRGTSKAYDVVLLSSPTAEPVPLGEDAHLWIVVKPRELADAQRVARELGCRYAGMLAWPGGAEGEADGVLIEDMALVLHATRGKPKQVQTPHGCIVTRAEELRAVIADACPGSRLDFHAKGATAEGWLAKTAPRRRSNGARSAGRSRKTAAKATVAA